MVFRLISLLYRLLPGDAARKEAVKSFVYSNIGSLFARSHNYAEWLRLQKTTRRLPLAPPPAEPSEADWREVIARKAGSSPGCPPQGDPYVVLPVYRGRSETLACIYSVLSADPHSPLVAIEDCSPEGDLSTSLRELADEGLFQLLHNRENLGFAPTVNRGMSVYPERDVVLLNSDTEVFGDWLARLNRTAHRESDIATVTPLSNNAEICSYPYWLRDNNMALEVGYATLDELAARVNQGLYAAAPTAVGFCMYLRRSCLDEVGLFDERFAKGYGEENDFCLRASQQGWRHVIAGDVFVRHVGSVSYRSGTLGRRRRALALLQERYPSYGADIQAYIRRDPLRQLRLNLDVARLVRGTPRRTPTRSVLFVVHHWGGGVEQHVEDMQRGLEAEGVDVYFLRPYAEPAKDCVSLSRPGVDATPNVDEIDTNIERQTLADVLRLIGIDHIHIHHLGGFGDVGVEWIRHIAGGIGRPYDITLHDYAPVCPRLHLNDGDGYYCGEPDIASCERCVAEQGSPFGFQPVWRWRDRWSPLLAGARRVFCPSQDVAERTRRYFPDAQYVVRPHQERAYASVSAPPPRRRGEPLRVAVPGAISEQKGFGLLVDCAEDARRRRLPIEYYVVGHTMNDTRARRAGVGVSGPYEPDQADVRLSASGCHLAFLPSVSPETYAFALSSALRAHMLPVVFDLGALAERVREIGWGTVLPRSLIGEPGRLNDALLALEVPPAPPVLSTPWSSNRYPSLVKDFYEDFAP